MKLYTVRIALCLLGIALLISPVSAVAGTYTVTHTGDSGNESLRWAIDKVNINPGTNLIDFAIPTTDPGYNALKGYWTISLLSELDSLGSDSTTIDGNTQKVYLGYDPNPDGGEIEIDGSSAGSATGLDIKSSFNTITGLTINRFEQFGIRIANSSPRPRFNSVRGNYVGTDPNGMIDLGNGLSGIMLYSYASQNTIGGPNPGDGNVVSGNGWSGIEIQGNDTDSNYVYGNFVGLNARGTDAIPNDRDGIYVWSGPVGSVIGGSTGLARNVVSGNGMNGININPGSTRSIVKGNYVGVTSLVAYAVPNGHSGIVCSGDHSIIGGTGIGEGNIIGGNGFTGIYVAGGDSLVVAGNIIGTDAAGILDIGNGWCGMYFYWGATDCTVGPSNTIRNNHQDGVRVEQDSTLGIRISQNSISHNDGLGINNLDGGNIELSPPVIVSSDAAATWGTAPPFSTVEVYSDDMDEGRLYEGAVPASGTGDWYWSGTATGPCVTAIAIDLSGNTSEFSSPWIPTDVAAESADHLPAAYSLNGNSPNPFNPLTTITYQLPVAGDVNLSIYNTVGERIQTLVNGWREMGTHSVTWSPRDDRIGSGIYFCRMESGDFSAVRKMTLMR